MFSTLAHRLRLNSRGRTATLASVIGVVLLVAVGATTVLTVHKAKADSQATATVNVDDQTGAQIPSSAVGVNTAAWDSLLTDGTTASYLQQAGVQIMRYPGGSTADNFHWYNQSVQCHADTTLPNTTTPEQGCGDLGPNDCSGCGVNFDQFMQQTVRPAGAQAMITVNYGSGSPAEAASWVHYADFNDASGFRGAFPPTYPGHSPTGNSYGIKYWEIGNEVYGNGTYQTLDPGSHWELNDLGRNASGNIIKRSLGPQTYATVLRSYASVMKIAPWIQIGAVLTAPTNWPDNDKVRLNPDGSTAGAYPMTWNDTVLSQSCSSIDFVDVHWYPQAPLNSGFGQESDSQLLNAAESGAADQSGNAGTRTKGIATMINDPTRGLRALINKWCGAHASQVQIMVTETNSVYGDPGKQTVSHVNALFEDDDIMTWLENGATNVDWWAAHNSPQAFDNQKYVLSNGANIVPNNFTNSTDLIGTSNFGDYGLLSNGGCVTIPNGPGVLHVGSCWTDPTTGSTINEPPVDTPFPAYLGMQMLTFAMNAGNSFLPTTSSTPMVTVHANRQFCAACGVDMLFINKDPNNTYDETVTLSGNGGGNERSTGGATVFTYGENSTGILGVPLNLNNSSTFNVTLPPYSLVTVELPQTTVDCNC